MAANTLPEPQTPPLKTRHDPVIPLFYRLTILYIEPLFALNGAFLLLTQPSTFLSFISPRHVTPDNFSSLGIFVDQLAALELLFAFNNGVLLRLCREEKVWRIVCLGELLTDVLHIGISVREVGWEVAMAPLTRWRMEEWVNFGIMGWMMVVRLGIVFGIGISDKEAKRSEGLMKGKSSDVGNH